MIGEITQIILNDGNKREGKLRPGDRNAEKAYLYLGV
jgi:hypothetical protein